MNGNLRRIEKEVRSINRGSRALWPMKLLLLSCLPALLYHVFFTMRLFR